VHWAAHHGMAHVLRTLLAAGAAAGIDSEDSEGWAGSGGGSWHALMALLPLCSTVTAGTVSAGTKTAGTVNPQPLGPWLQLHASAGRRRCCWPPGGASGRWQGCCWSKGPGWIHPTGAE
jgi:hypothetical protein